MAASLPRQLDRASAILKRKARRGVDRAVLPYVEQVVARLSSQIPPTTEPPPSPAAPAPPPGDLLHNVLHTARTIALSGMPPVSGTLLSAGPNGKWYFDWLDDAYVRVGRHIAVEAYVPRPDNLPSEVEWVEADIAAPDGIGAVRDAEVDLVFSGQNIEHLWPDQVIAFLLESSRVIRPGGWLVIDSPNRDITASYRWSMAEHTMEFTPSEARSLLEIAGFEVRSMRGLWLCRRNGEMLPLAPTTLSGLDTLNRLAFCGRRPEDSFIWWAESVKVAEPKEQELREAVDSIYRGHWTERVNRLNIRDGASMDDSARSITIPKGTTGYPVDGPYMTLPDGTFIFKLPISWSDCSEIGSTIAKFEVIIDGQCAASTPIEAVAPSGSTIATADVHVQGPAFGSHVRLFASGGAGIQMPLELSIEPEPWRVANS